MRTSHLFLVLTMVTACGGTKGPVLHQDDAGTGGNSSPTGGTAAGTGGSVSGSGGSVIGTSGNTGSTAKGGSGVGGTGIGGRSGAGGTAATGGVVSTGGKAGGSGGVMSTAGGTTVGGSASGGEGGTGGGNATRDAGVGGGTGSAPNDAGRPLTNPQCCSSDEECKEGFECAGASLGGGSRLGTCEWVAGLTAGQCWRDSDCPASSGGCVSTGICGCLNVCGSPDHPGVCGGTGGSGGIGGSGGAGGTGGVVGTRDAGAGGGTGGAPSDAGRPSTNPSCCSFDQECKEGFECAGIASSGGGFGQCESVAGLAAGQCWRDSDCPASSCVGPGICGCGMSCESPDHPGTCAGTSTDTCGGTAAKTCSAGLFCDLASKCGTIDDAAGSCVAKRSDCGADYMPVCGCDGKTYPGDCWRIQAGVLKASDGACASDGGTTTPACPFDCRTSSSGVTGWYSGDSLICAAACTGDTATCDKAGTKSEGCYATGPAGAGKGCSGTGSLILYATCSK